MGRIENLEVLEVLKELPAVVRVVGKTYDYRSILKALGYKYSGYSEAGWVKRVEQAVGEELKILKEKLPYLVIWEIKKLWGEREEDFREPHLYVELYLDKDIYEKMEALYKNKEEEEE